MQGIADQKRAHNLIAFFKRLEEAENWAGLFPPPDLLPLLQAIAGAGDSGEAKLSVAVAKKWAMFIPTAQSLVLLLNRANLNGLLRIDWAGSVAKGTAVDPFTADLDMVLIFRDFTPGNKGKEHDRLLLAVEEALKATDLQATISRRAFYFSADLAKLDDGGAEVAVPGPTTMGTETISDYLGAAPPSAPPPLVKLEAKYIHIVPERGPSVDLLIGGDVPNSVMDVFRDDNKDEHLFWSASCAAKCVEFVRKQPPQVLTAIRALKAWRNELGIQKGKFRPSSFLLELLCIAAYERRGADTPRAVFINALKMIAAPDTEIEITWTTYYTMDHVPAHVAVQRPLVLDPIKPYNNVVRPANLKFARKHAQWSLNHLGVMTGN